MAANPECHIELDNSEMFTPQLEFPAPINLVCKKCVDACDISSKISTRKSSAETILGDLAVNGVIVCKKSLRKKALRKLKKRGSACTGV